jgi:2-polyprenyl-3-methyl-5-hydroxy-6-metoxy-1,4-benzoquinol methylase
MIPKEVKTVLDIGCANSIFKDYEVTTVDCIEKADYNINLNKIQKLPFKDNSFDLVVVNQILEHIGDVEELIGEVKRVSKKYIQMGLPNEMT